LTTTPRTSLSSQVAIAKQTSRRPNVDVVNRPATWLILLGFILCLLVTATASASQGSAPGALVVRSSKLGGFTVPVPAGWRYRNASYPSDHSTEYWTDPADPKTKLEVIVSACIGCVEKPSCTLHETGCGPYPVALVPNGTISKRHVGRWSERFTARNALSPYLLRGIVAIRHHGSSIIDWAYVELWVPQADAKIASSMLAGFKLV
jgi:hypothetical protein